MADTPCRMQGSCSDRLEGEPSGCYEVILGHGVVGYSELIASADDEGLPVGDYEATQNKLRGQHSDGSLATDAAGRGDRLMSALLRKRPIFNALARCRDVPIAKIGVGGAQRLELAASRVGRSSLTQREIPDPQSFEVLDFVCQR